jgi:hypothetical protein
VLRNHAAKTNQILKFLTAFWEWFEQVSFELQLEAVKDIIQEAS